jgi:hypothetical protein
MTNLSMFYFLIGILAVGVLLFAVVSGGNKPGKRTHYRGAPSSHGYRGFIDPTEIRPRWDLIMATSKTGASGLKSAINEADKLMDHVMKQLGFSGETMGERLKHGRARFSTHATYDGVWRAHKLRNSLAHEMGFDLVVSQATEALKDFERGLKELGAL